ncbi:MAG: TrbI/VirB10 family protein [Acidobacteriota bacterium]
MVTVAHSADSAAARTTPAQKVSGRSGEPLWKTVAMVLLVMAVIGLFIHKAFAPARKEESQAAFGPQKLVTAADLTAGLPPLAATKEEPPRPAPAPPPAPVVQERPHVEATPVAPPAEGPKKPVLVSSIAVRREPPVPGATKALATPGPRMRHVPRGTIMSGFLESRILSDNLDSRVRVQLVEDYRLGSDVVLPAGGTFIGQAMEVGSRYQKRLAVRVGNFIYPDGEREVPFSGLLLNPDESAHLLADDVQHHTGKLIAGTTALAVLGAATGVLGSAHGEGLAPIAGANAANGLGEVAQKNVEHLAEIVPTLVVEPGKPCWIFVDQSFDVPQYDQLPRGYAPAAAPPAAAAAVDPRLDMMRAQMEQVGQMMAGLPTLREGGNASR